MSDYELLSVFMAQVQALWEVFSTFVSVVFAFLVVSYLVASKLRRSLAAVAIALYTLVALWAAWALSRGAASVAAIAQEMKNHVRDGTSTLGWHPAANTPDVVGDAIPIGITLIALLAYLGSVFFFYVQRRTHRAE